MTCKCLAKRFGGISALENVSLEFTGNNVVAIVGPNGAGKTTLLNVLSGFLRPDAGRWFLNDRELTDLRPDQIAASGIARTFQEMRILRSLTVIENVLLARPQQRGEHLWRAISGIGVRGQESMNREIGMEVLTFLGLAGCAHIRAATLSYGQQKLLTIACCLAMEATVLLLDEPVAGVHPTVAERLCEKLRELRGQGKLIMFVEHDLDIVRTIADHLIVMDEGKVIARGDPSNVLEQAEVIEAYLD
jgi:ABC-type branched-subunit amino acid transport system ATPase component